MLGFVILRHVNSELTDKYWKESYNCVREFYPDNKIIIIDDNSNYEFVTEMELKNTEIIQSEYHGRGELLPYIYFLRYRWFEKMVFIHDSVFIKRYIDFDNIVDYKFLWHFNKGQYDNNDKIISIIEKLDNSRKLIKFHNKKLFWQNGCFGVMMVIKYDFLELLNNKYNLELLIKYIKTRDDRCCLERIMALLCQCEKEKYLEDLSFFGYIFEYYHLVTYCKIHPSYDYYINNSNDYKLKSIVKVWSGR